MRGAMLLLRCGLPMAWLLAAATAIPARAATVRPLADRPDVIEMANDLLTVRIDLVRGARVASFVYAGFDNQDVVYDVSVDNGGLVKDLWTAQGWPGEFDKRLYESRIVKSGPAEVVLETSTLSTGAAKGKTNEALSDLRIMKTFTLRDGDRGLHVKVAITNEGAVGKRPAYWSQHALDFDGKRKNTQYWRPTRHGVDVIGQGIESANGYWYTAAPTAGWNGATNAALSRGLMFLMDYNAVQQLYDNVEANTVEWMYDDTAIPAGKTWVTEMTLIPTEGFAGYRHGDRSFVGHFEAYETPGGLLVQHVVAAGTMPLTDVTVQTRVRGARDGWAVSGEPLTVASLGFAPLVKRLPVLGVGAMPCVIEVTVTGKAADGSRQSATYADYFGGSVGRNVNLELLEPYHEFKPPAKKRQYLKPDRIERARNAKPRVLFIRGLWADFQGLDQALANRTDIEVVNGWMKRTALGESLGNFPASYEELLSYDAIVLANVSGAMLGDVGEEMLADFAKAGGGILFLSGDRTYGQAGFANPRLLQLLPAVFKTGGDYARLATPSPLVRGADHSLAAGELPSADALVLHAHDVRSAAGAVVVLALADGRPAVIATPPGQPRLVVVTPLPFGTVTTGGRLFFNDPGWHAFLSRTLSWLMAVGD
ncbi:MAG: hypothetical protein NTY17_08075 [Planctomycetia bacterium]|nr:hypothetical protein [Planctomycetia bacterium]